MRIRIVWPRKAAFIYPIPPAPRTAILLPGYQSRGRVRVFAEGWCAEVARFAPQAIAATLAQFEAIAATEISLSHAAIVMGHWRDARVTEMDRERLWRRFRVPVFEQIVGENGTLLAAECEAHCGLHLVGGAPRTPARAPVNIDQLMCACGKATPRFVIGDDVQRHTEARAAGQ